MTSTPFLPSQNAPGFDNAWPNEPAVTASTPFGPIEIGNAASGLCGGMVFTALDYFHAGTPAPVPRPGPKDALYKYVVRRLLDSWNLPAGVLEYYHWMNLPDGDSGFTVMGHHVTSERGLAFRTITQEWPTVQADIDHGVPSPLGLVTVHSSNPKDLGHCHQVLAFGYDVAGTGVTVHVYDPNSGRDDTVTISFDSAAPTQPTVFASTVNIANPVRGFFRTPYTPSSPPMTPT